MPLPIKTFSTLSFLFNYCSHAIASSSSPTSENLKMKINNEVASDVSQCSYTSWTQKYPSALGSFPKIMDSAKGKQIALFLDYDGTLSPIVDDPDHAFMSDTMRSAVRDVAKYFPTAIVSGRSRDKVCKFVGLTELYYAGSHGMDIMGPVREFSADKKQSLFQPASEFLREIEKVFISLVEKTKEIQGAKVEDNKFCVSVHYRNADERNKDKIKQIVDQVLEENFNLRLTYGKKVFEIRPVIDWDKGKAVKFLLDSLGLTERADVLPIYVGDDRTDEDAFRVLKERNRGYGILVSSVPKESDAFFSLKDPSEVLEFLKSLAKQGPRNVK